MKRKSESLIPTGTITALLLGLLFAATHADAGATLYGVTGAGGTPSATLHIINQSDASLTPILPLNDNNGGQVIAWNPNDGCMYHWTGWPQANALFEKIDLETLTVTNIPLSGFQTNEIYGAAYNAASGNFLTTDVGRSLTMVTPDGQRTRIGTTPNWVRGLTFRGQTLYGGHNSLVPVNSLFEIDPATGAFLSTTPVTLAGYTVASFAAMAAHPDTGELWAVLLVLELPKKSRLLTKLDPQTGDATLVGALPDFSGISSIAFVPDPVTFESTAQDIANGLAADLIDNSGVAQSLLAKLKAAAQAANDQPETATRMLIAFALELEAQSGKHLSPEMADLLLKDAAALIEALGE
jgi:hypothetical protein